MRLLRNNFERILAIAVVIAYGFSAYFVFATLAAPDPAPKLETPAELSLPARCHQYYNDGTNRWKDCMGVGYR